MPDTFPKDPHVFMQWNWSHIQPYTDQLLIRPITAETLQGWMMDWSDLNRIISEMYARLFVGTSLDTANQAAQNRFNTYLDEIYAPFQAVNYDLKQKLLSSGLQPTGCDVSLRHMRVEAEIYRLENLPLQNEEKRLINEYDAVIGAEMVEWEGREVTPTQLQPVFLSLDREERENAWRLCMQRRLKNRHKLNQIWCAMLDLRNRMAANAGFADYRAYRWKVLLRIEYTPEDCQRFHRAIEDAGVPAASRIYQQRKERLGFSCLRPWDLNVDTLGREALKPFETIGELEDKVSGMFHRLDGDLGKYFDFMCQHGLLDLENRKGKAPGAYCNNFDMTRLPFIFANAVGLHADLSTLVHEAGHAFHVFEEASLPYYQQLQVGMEFSEIASMAMELLVSRYLATSEGGFYSEQDAARAQIEHLEEEILFWPYMAVVDEFQHWAYTDLEQAKKPDNCDLKWAELWRRYMPGVDWSGLEEAMVTGWQRKPHIFEDPFYYIDYGLASMGALQVWRNAMKDQKAAVAAYRRALALGGTATIPELYEAIGARFAMDEANLRDVITLVEEQIAKLEDIK